MDLRLFLDSADLHDWKRLWPSGMFCGITTNPTLLLRAKRSCTLRSLEEVVAAAVALQVRELHLQAWGSDAKALETCGRALAALAPGAIRVKLPLTEDGLKAARSLIDSGISVTFTACYAADQVLLATALKADYVAPYLGRINDQGRDGTSEILTMQKALRSIGSNTRLLVASLRKPGELAALASGGCDTFTISASLAHALMNNPHTADAARQFEKDVVASD